jgi:muramidase (phage lysozyme)
MLLFNNMTVFWLCQHPKQQVCIFENVSVPRCSTEGHRILKNIYISYPKTLHMINIMSAKEWFPDIPYIKLKPQCYNFSPLWTLLCLVRLVRKEKLL